MTLIEAARMLAESPLVVLLAIIAVVLCVVARH